jgi:hypothetical protein
MFDIDDISAFKDYSILDCPSGASSFVAEAKNKYGIHAVGCDPLFGEGLNILAERGKADIEYVMQRVSRIPAYYNWDFYPSIKVLERIQNTGFTTSYIRLSYRNYRKTIYKSRVTLVAI